MTDDTTVTKSLRGRPAGSYKPGSLIARLLDLDPGASALEEDTGDALASECKRALRVVKSSHPERTFEMRLYLGVAIKADTLPIRFYRIQRIT
jgi:hypothetical protein